jgi:hypothetical protein
MGKRSLTKFFMDSAKRPRAWLKSRLFFFIALAVVVLAGLANGFWQVRLLGLAFRTFAVEAPNAGGGTRLRYWGPKSWKNNHDIPLHAGLDNSVSACLMFMDDNHLLVEWLAYHYFVMPLRHVVVAPDPLSRTSPMEVLERWKPYMTIEVWNDTLNLDTTNTLKGHLDLEQRQTQFYSDCGLYLRARNRTWTMFTDVDEYWAIHEHVVPDWKSRMQQPGAILKLMTDVSQMSKPDKEVVKTWKIGLFKGTAPASIRFIHHPFSSFSLCC